MIQPESPPGVEVEQVFLVEAQYTPEAPQRQPSVRAEHLARIAELRRAGTVLEAGAYADAMTLSILLVRAEDAEAALKLARRCLRPGGRLGRDQGPLARTRLRVG